jgi:amidase
LRVKESNKTIIVKKVLIILITLIFIGCKKEEKEIKYFKKYDEAAELKSQQEHQNPRMKYKLIQSKYLDMNEVFKPFQKDLSQFTEKDYTTIKPLVLEKSIPAIQQSVKEGKLNFEKLTLFYLYRIRKFESDSTKYLNAIISLNPNVVNEAREKDKLAQETDVDNQSVFGMPILLKDNINTSGMNTTAGAEVLKSNNPEDAFIVSKLKNHGALILGKVNLSEWAYYFCSGCPLGYSAIGGQTLNPYGRKEFETGGSSSGSGVATAANYAVATIGSETAGSITSPSSLNSVVGLKPTIGLLSRSGIVPISSTLDTPGPMTKNVMDSYILFKTLLGADENDPKSKVIESVEELTATNFKDKRIGVLKSLLADSIYNKTVHMLKDLGNVIEIAPEQTSLPGFLTLLNIDMKHDLPSYLEGKNTGVSNVGDIVTYNQQDSLKRAPYGQQLFEGIVKDTTTVAQLEVIKESLKKEGIEFFKAFDEKNLDVILSINNYHAAYSAVAEYPNLTIPMGYKESGEPISLTFIGKPKSEFDLLSLGLFFEKLTHIRKLPKGYE